MLKKISITAIVILLLPALLFAQSNKESAWLKAARKDHQDLKYVAAIQTLLLELKANPAEKEAQELIADCYRKIKDYSNAVYWYGELTRSENIKPEWALYYAEALANKQQYKASEEWYNKYVLLTTRDDRASSFAKAYANVDVFLSNRGDWKLSYLNINTAAAEYSPMYFRDGLLFISNRKIPGVSKRVFEWDQTPFSDIYYVDKLSDIKPVNIDSIKNVLRAEIKASGRKLYKENDDDTPPTSNDSRVLGGLSTKLLKDTLGDYLAAQVRAQPLIGAINAKYHEGPTALLPDGSIIFTRNNYFGGKYSESRDGINKLKLYTAKVAGYDNIEPFPYNNDQYSVGHPALNTAGTLLIFASDMPGGSGGTDLYYCKRANTHDIWGKPVNMGAVINTTGNEMFPVLYQDSILYFSSTGHPGLGGLDIFQVALNNVEPLHVPINLGAPINSSVDDFGLIRSEDGRSGFLTSNRNGSDDIYSFNYLPFRIKLKGVVVDAQTDHVISNSTVTILPEGRSNLITNDMGRFERSLKKGVDYTAAATKEGYITGVEAHVNTSAVTSDTTLTVLLKLNKIKTLLPQLAVKLPGCDSLKELVAVKKIYYDLDKSFIRMDAHAELEHLINVLNSNPLFNVILASHCDMRASVAYNIALSLRRSTSARAYLIKNGISASRIKIEYYGKSRLVNNCTDGIPCTELEHQLNRRTEFILIKDGKELQNMDCDSLQKVYLKDWSINVAP